MADPERYRTREQVDQWRERDPIESFAGRLAESGILSAESRERIDADVVARIDAAVAFADSSPEPTPDSLWDNVYSLGGEVNGWLSTQPPQEPADD
jgi:pyruvate dehydrogenase E1 component alpha subunit